MLKILEFQQELGRKKADLNLIEERIGEIRSRQEAAQSKNAELERRVDALAADAGQNEMDTIDKEIDENNAAMEQAKADETEAANERETLRKIVADLENKLAELAAKATGTRKEVCKMNTRKLKMMNMEERSAFAEREDIKEFCDNVRTLGAQKRTVTGGALGIPTVVLDIIRESIPEYSKLYKYVRVQAVRGKARQVITGTIPEAVWTEAAGKINELSITLGGCEVDGFKVGGYIGVANSTLADDDNINLTAVIADMIAAAIGKALDKAILYGTGTKMPLGILPRLAQTSAPTTGHTFSNNWTDVHSSNITAILTANSTGTKLFQALINAFGKCEGKYSNGGKFFAMNETTFATLQSEALNINAAGAVVSGMNMTMPVLGGDVVLLDFVPDKVIIGGYGDGYLLVEREGTQLESSTDALFTDDMTVFKGTARYDGVPVVGQAFVAVVFDASAATGVPSSTGATFATDSKNT